MYLSDMVGKRWRRARVGGGEEGKWRGSENGEGEGGKDCHENAFRERKARNRNKKRGGREGRGEIDTREEEKRRRKEKEGGGEGT